MRQIAIILSCLVLWLPPPVVAAQGLLDGQSFSGVIGPSDNPDLDDTLHFADGHFWSGICTRCGFMPGPYKAERTAKGIEFSGILRSEDRGKFTYQGIVKETGEIQVDIAWERQRWYWTARREIVFRGTVQAANRAVRVSEIRERIEMLDPDADPACARF